MSKMKSIESWLDEIRPFGDILEIGLGAPLPLKPFLPKSLTHIDLEQEGWQRKLILLGSFDFILYNGKVIDKAHVEAGSLLLQQGKKTLQSVQENLPELSKIRYTDRDLDAFCQEIGEKQKPYLSRFLSELLENGQISEAQYQTQIAKNHLKKIAPHKIREQTDHLFECLQESLKHMRKGSRFSCLIGASSKYEDPRFFEHIITNPSFDYQEKPIGDSNYLLIEML